MADLIVCADDFAQSAAIDEAIIALIQRGILSATSCLTLSPRWPQAARWLTPTIRQQADIGLHLDFTQYAIQVRHAHPQLVWRSLCHGLSSNAVRHNIRQQLDTFEQKLGTPPDYIDGHLHVHQLPVIRDCLLAEMLQRYGQLQPHQRPWLRISSPPVGSGLKARLIHWLGAKALAKTAQAAGVRFSPHLLGVYDFTGEVADYLQHWQHWVQQLQQLPPRGRMHVAPVLMCHPARPPRQTDTAEYDPIAAARVVEWQAMQSPAFAQWLSQVGITPVRGQP